jgi:hypothetical protein
MDKLDSVVFSTKSEKRKISPIFSPMFYPQGGVVRQYLWRYIMLSIHSPEGTWKLRGNSPKGSPPESNPLNPTF